jgi:hypothetical protein
MVVHTPWDLVSIESLKLKWYFLICHLRSFKVENILKGSLDSIPSPSPSVKIQIIGRKVCLRCKGKTLLGDVNRLFVFKSFDNSQQCFALLSLVNFPANNLNFR